MTRFDMVEVCDCCALMMANGDESGCRDYYGHTHAPCNLPAAMIGDDLGERWGRYTWTCDGCGSEMLPGAVVWSAYVPTELVTDGAS